MSTFSPIPDSPEFLRWYSHYPRKQARGDAKKAWEQTKHIRPPIEQMVKALIVQKEQEQWRNESGKYVPLPATYLRREQWSDVTEIELAQVNGNDKLWWQTVSGVEHKAQELNFGSWNPNIDKTYQAYVERLKKFAQETTSLRAVK